MAIHTQQSFSGFIASDPSFEQTEKGDARLYFRVGQEHYRRNPDGSFTELESTFHNLILYRATAERARDQFVKGDRFIAEGYLHEYSLERDGQTVPGEEFVAKKIGHDLARTNYTVDRSRRTTPAAQRETGEFASSKRDSPASSPAIRL